MIMTGLNAEHILVAAESLGLGYASIRHASRYAAERVVFGRPIGKYQGIQHPLARSWVHLEAARLMIYLAGSLYDQGHSSGEYANGAKYLAAEAAWEAAKSCSILPGVLL